MKKGVKSDNLRKVSANTLPIAPARPNRLLLLATLLVCGVLLAVAMGAAFVLTSSRGAAVPGLTPTGAAGVVPTEGTVVYTTEAGQGVAQGVPNSPLKIVADFPRKSQVNEEALSVVLMELLDDQGHLAQFGSATPQPIDLKSTMDLAIWNYDGSMPTRPGVYHPRFTLKRLFGDAKPETVELPQALLRVTPETGTPLTSGYVSNHNNDLWLISTDANKRRRLTFVGNGRSDQYAEGAEWSPDGKRVAFTYLPKVASSEVPATDIWTINSDGTDAKMLVAHAPDEALSNPFWSKDGKYVYFTVEITVLADPATPTLVLGGSTWRIDRVEASTGVRTPWAKDAMSPTTGGPGGDVVYLEQAANTGADADPTNPMYRLVRTHSDGTGRVVLVDSVPALTVIGQRLSPDGKWVVYTTIVNNGGGGGGERQGSNFDFFRWLTFQPDVAEAHGLPWDLFIVPADGSGKPVRLTTLLDDEPHPVWLDNSNLALMGANGFYTLKIDASGKLDGTPARLGDGSRHATLSWHAP